MADRPMPSVLDAAAAIRGGEFTSTQLVERCLRRIAAANPALNALVHLDSDAALQRAAFIDAEIAAGRGDALSPLAGVPFGVKDLEDCAGMPTARGSSWFKGRSPVDADDIHVARLRAAGAIPLGKTAVPEFGAFAYTSSPALVTTRNPCNTTRTPGGRAAAPRPPCLPASCPSAPRATAAARSARPPHSRAPWA